MHLVQNTEYCTEYPGRDPIDQMKHKHSIPNPKKNIIKPNAATHASSNNAGKALSPVRLP